MHQTFTLWPCKWLEGPVIIFRQGVRERGWGVVVGGFWSCHNKIYLIPLWHPYDPPHWQSIFSDPPQAPFPLETFLFHFFLAFENSHVVSKIKKFQSELLISVNPLTPMSDQDRISPYNINTKPTRWVTRIKKNIKLGIISSSNNKFSALALYKLYGWQEGEWQIWSGI